MKPRIYVETSVISYLAARPSRNALTGFRQLQTRRWLDKAAVLCTLEVSELVRLEIAAGDPTAAKRRLDFLATMSLFNLHDGVGEFAKRLLSEGLVPRSEPEDASLLPRPH